jgi:hypothetical protein
VLGEHAVELGEPAPPTPKHDAPLPKAAPSRTGSAVLDRLVAEGRATPARITDGSVPRRAPPDPWVPLARILAIE